MLEVAINYQKAFERLEDIDSKFLIEFGDELPNEHDWNNARNLTRFLKRFYDVTCKVYGSLYCTSNVYFPEIIKILKDLQTFERSNDSSLVEMGKKMREKFDKYWGALSKLNVMLFIAVVLDPRYKMNYLRVKYTTYYGENESQELVDRITKALKIMMDEYNSKNEERVETVMNHCPLHNEIDEAMEEEIDDYFIELEKEKQLAAKGELERYLDEFSEKFTLEFDILAWWKVNSVRFRTLSKVAKDVLAIQSSTVASESAFSTGGRTLDRFRSSLTPITAEVLICCQDWLRNSNKPIQIEEILEELESFESGMIFTY